MKDLSLSEIERQEELSSLILNNLTAKSNADYPNRPFSSFIDLMNWTLSAFQGELGNKTNLEKFIHNRIMIDGQFLRYCNEVKATVECLYKDSIVSWNTDNNFEKFFMQGVFLIRYKGLEFLHAALFHKGTQNEDEISFFVILSHDNYEKYISFRNEFEKWSKDRERGNLFVRVIGGEDIEYTREHTWNDIFLSSELKKDIMNLVECFLSSRDFYLSNRIPWKRGFLLYGPPGCGKTSIIKTIISCYDFKPVTIASGADDELLRDAFTYAERNSPSLLYFEDLDSILGKNIGIPCFLNLVDGISTKDGILIIGTANNILDLKDSIKRRPSRFDRKFKIPLPDKNMIRVYLKKWFGKNIATDAKYKELTEYIFKNKLSFAFMKEIYISSMFSALSNNRKQPSQADIDNAVKLIINDKNSINNVMISTDNYI